MPGGGVITRFIGRLHQKRLWQGALAESLQSKNPISFSFED